jgi:hypothetical protein
MNKFVTYAFYLVALLLILAYYKGFSSNVDSAAGGVNRILRTLQGRDPDTGNFENYPS